MRGLLLSAAVAVAAICVCPALAASSAAVTHVTWHRNGILTWERVERHAISPQTLHRLSVNLAPDHSKVISSGSPGLVEVRVRCTQRDGGPVHQSVVSRTVLREAKPRVVAEGIGSTSLSAFEAHGISHMAIMARNAMEMLATAYTPGSAGGDGMTAIGRRAGYGIVAVDPRVIPLGTRLYIAGYGIAVAGDTGGDIVGNRIDLGFDSLRDAMLFGRRAVKVYRI
ncbi:MAG TPA: 3D domain-containing protein [Candidatus Nitrosotalea sp.]|nr:3D domain-containing protein [Candidatus Nitrosotalea sp.]